MFCEFRIYVDYIVFLRIQDIYCILSFLCFIPELRMFSPGQFLQHDWYKSREGKDAFTPITYKNWHRRRIFGECSIASMVVLG